MEKPKVYIAKDLPKNVEKYISKHFDYEMWKDDGNISYLEILNKIKDVDGVLLSRIKIDENLLNHAPKLRAVSNMSVGYDNFDIQAMKKRGVLGSNTAGVLDDSVADLVFGLIIGAGRRIPELDRYVKQGKWRTKDDESIYGKAVSKSSIGIIGMGRIGEGVARRAKLGFDMDVYYYNRSRKKDIEKSLGVKYLEFSLLLERCDYVVLMTPLTKETYHMFGEKEFSLMKKDGILINASRGQTVDEKALIKALNNNEILGAGLDVYQLEPVDENNPLLKMENVITLPHIGSSVRETRDAMAMKAAENLVDLLYKGKCLNIVSELSI